MLKTLVRRLLRQSARISCGIYVVFLHQNKLKDPIRDINPLLPSIYPAPPSKSPTEHFVKMEMFHVYTVRDSNLWLHVATEHFAVASATAELNF